MSITKLVAMLIPVITVVIWIYLFLVIYSEISLIRFLLVVILVPAVFISFYIAILVWRKSKPKI